MGTAVEDAGGHVDKFIGDGRDGIVRGQGKCCRGMPLCPGSCPANGASLEEINVELENDLKEPLRIGIGIHTGSVVIGEMGHGAATSWTAIGDAVNTASRLEAMTKEQGVQLIVSDDVCSHADVDLSTYPTTTVEVRGRKDPIVVRMVSDAYALPSIVDIQSNSRTRKTPLATNVKEPA